MNIKQDYHQSICPFHNKRQKPSGLAILSRQNQGLFLEKAHPRVCSLMEIQRKRFHIARSREPHGFCACPNFLESWKAHRWPFVKHLLYSNNKNPSLLSVSFTSMSLTDHPVPNEYSRHCLGLLLTSMEPWVQIWRMYRNGVSVWQLTCNSSTLKVEIWDPQNKPAIKNRLCPQALWIS